jgi:hypothetical protein
MRSLHLASVLFEKQENSVDQGRFSFDGGVMHAISVPRVQIKHIHLVCGT